MVDRMLLGSVLNNCPQVARVLLLVARVFNVCRSLTVGVGGYEHKCKQTQLIKLRVSCTNGLYGM